MPAAPTTSPARPPKRRRDQRAPTSARRTPMATAPTPRMPAATADAAAAVAAVAAVTAQPAARSGSAREAPAARGDLPITDTIAARPATGATPSEPPRPRADRR